MIDLGEKSDCGMLDNEEEMSTSEEEDDEEEEDDVPLVESKREKSAFVDAEADVSDDGDADVSDEEDEDEEGEDKDDAKATVDKVDDGAGSQGRLYLLALSVQTKAHHRHIGIHLNINSCIFFQLLYLCSEVTVSYNFTVQYFF